MRSTVDGTMYEMNGDRYNGGYSGYGTGANSALPGGSWRLPSGPFGFQFDVDSGDGVAPLSRRHAPDSPLDTTPSIPAETLPVATPPATTPPTDGDGEQTDTQRLIDAFRAMFGTPERRNRDDGSVVLVDAAPRVEAGAGVGGVPVKTALVIVAAGGAGWWLWRRYGRKAAA